MKLHTLLPTLAIAGLVVLPALSQQKKNVDDDPFAEGSDAQPKSAQSKEEQLYAALPKLLQVQVEWIEMSHETLTELMFLRDPKGDSTALRKEVQKLVKGQKAEITETSIVLSRSGQKASTESIREHIYPTEYEPSELTSELRIDAAVDEKALSQLRTPATPTAFETRNVGTTLEVEAIVGADNKTIDLRLSPEIVIDTGETVWQRMKDALGNDNKVTMPLFYSLRTSTGLTLRDGQYRLVSVQSPHGEDGEVDRTRKIMIFAKCDIVRIGEESLGK